MKTNLNASFDNWTNIVYSDWSDYLWYTLTWKPICSKPSCPPGQTPVVLASYGNVPTSYLFSSGGSALLPGTTWNYYDPSTGALMMSIANATASSYYLVDGTNLAYGTYNGRSGCLEHVGFIVSNLLTSMSIPVGTAIIGNWPAGIMWAVPLPTPNAGTPRRYPISSSCLRSISRWIYNCCKK